MQQIINETIALRGSGATIEPKMRHNGEMFACGQRTDEQVVLVYEATEAMHVRSDWAAVEENVTVDDGVGWISCVKIESQSLCLYEKCGNQIMTTYVLTMASVGQCTHQRTLSGATVTPRELNTNVSIFTFYKYSPRTH